MFLSVRVLTVYAATLPAGLNSATVPVTSQSPADLHPALVNAFSQVLIKISGNSRIITLPGIQQQLPEAERFAQKYRYIGTNLQVAFDEHALITLLAEAQQPIWLSARPATLIWLSVSGKTPVVPVENNPDPTPALLQNAADSRAVPIVFPKMDSSDQADWQAKLGGAAVNQAGLEKIGARYQLPAVLYGELNQAADQSWTADWFLVWRGQTWQWRDSQPQSATVLQGAIDKLADLMGSELAVSLDQQDANNLWLAVLGVENLTEYSAMLNELKRCPPVLGVAVQDVGSHGVLLQVTTIGQGADALQSALANNPHFAPLSTATADSQALHYQWKS